ncbi:MAG: Fe-S cluster assembly ATPase SufC [Lentisphaeria bacterium]|jgi:Fe-S cluster assembly ATP-binding protein|nr:Fe-S cluster assembly ATPase SufC [Lentisphaeria bacterium]MDP7742348.1 Fe-S cluster assembly ATPase SufC [Lentisphaeria bacterium]
MLEVKDLHAEVDCTPILKGVNLSVRPGEVHAIMGPNGSGKSTLAQVLAGHESFKVTGGSVAFDGKDLLTLAPEERAREGVFLAFQYPVEIPGVSNTYLLKAAVNAIRKHRNEDELDAIDFLKMFKSSMKLLDLDESLINRPVNEGFSGGEKKRNEVFQMMVLNPKLAILDEADSGLDIDAVKIVAKGVAQFRNDNNAVVIVTHYQRLLDYIEPDFVHVLYDGRIVRSGVKDLALELEEHGYDWLKNSDA